jgi:hypothetical protein
MQSPLREPRSFSQNLDVSEECAVNLVLKRERIFIERITSDRKLKACREGSQSEGP